MKSRTNIATITILLLFLGAACTPQIRFASKPSDIRTASSTKKSSSSTVKTKNDINSFNMTQYLNNSNIDMKRKEVLMFAESYIGTPYCYGGIDKNCTDCSGFVKQIYDMAGINLPRTAALQYDYSREISDNEINPADLVFFTRNNKIGHVGIYIGDKKFIHASTNNGVIIQSLEDDYYKRTFAGFKKVLQ